MKQAYLTYDAAELAAEDSFIRWLGGDPEVSAAWEAWLAAHPERAGVVAEARRLHAQVQVAAGPLPPVDQAALWARIEAAAYAPAAPSRARMRTLVWTLSAAAAVILLLWLARGLWPGEATLLSPEGQRLSFVLPDSSHLHLNAGSRLTYPARRFTAHRYLQLEGEAFFTVQPGSPFVVETPAGRVEVLGTAFNVYSREGSFRVACQEGKVRVRHTGGTEAILLPGQAFAVSAQGAVVQDSADLAQVMGWMEGRFAYEDAPLDQVLGELARQYAIDLRWEAQTGQARFTGTFTGDSLAAALQTVAWPMGLAVERRDSVYYLRPDSLPAP